MSAVVRQNLDIFRDCVDSCIIYVKAVFSDMNVRIGENVSVGYPSPHKNILLHLEGLEMFDVSQGGIKQFGFQQAYWLNILHAFRADGTKGQRFSFDILESLFLRFARYNADFRVSYRPFCWGRSVVFIFANEYPMHRIFQWIRFQPSNIPMWCKPFIRHEGSLDGDQSFPRNCISAFGSSYSTLHFMKLASGVIGIGASDDDQQDGAAALHISNPMRLFADSLRA